VSGNDFTLDRFLGGRLTITQPKKGFRAGHDTVLLAATVPAEAGSHCLELGAGTGVASLCLAARIPGVFVLGLEIDQDLVRLANEKRRPQRDLPIARGLNQAMSRDWRSWSVRSCVLQSTVSSCERQSVAEHGTRPRYARCGLRRIGMDARGACVDEVRRDGHGDPARGPC
jgi:hypothetical protein